MFKSIDYGKALYFNSNLASLFDPRYLVSKKYRNETIAGVKKQNPNYYKQKALLNSDGSNQKNRKEVPKFQIETVGKKIKRSLSIPYIFRISNMF